MKVVKVPRVTRRAFDTHRNASDLLRRQVDQLEHIVTRLRGPHALKRTARRVRTEAQAAAFVTDALRVLKLAPPAPPAPAKRKPSRRKAAKKSAARKTTKAMKKSTARKPVKKAKQVKKVKRTARKPAKKTAGRKGRRP